MYKLTLHSGDDLTAVWPYIAQALAFTQHGYDPKKYQPQETALGQCRPSKGQCGYLQFGFTWLPQKPRQHRPPFAVPE